MSIWSFMSTKGQGHSLILVQIFSWITTRPIEAKFRVEPPWDGGTKAYSNGPGHITKMATMPILKSSSLEPKGCWLWTLVCSIKYYQVYSNDTPSLTLTCFMASQFWSPMLLHGKKLNNGFLCPCSLGPPGSYSIWVVRTSVRPSIRFQKIKISYFIGQTCFSQLL